MLKSIIGEQLWAEMTEVQKVEAVCSGRATLKQLTSAEPSNQLRNVCREFLARTDASLEDISLDTDTGKRPAEKANPRLRDKVLKTTPPNNKKKTHRPRKPKQRFGLPEGGTDEDYACTLLCQPSTDAVAHRLVQRGRVRAR